MKCCFAKNLMPIFQHHSSGQELYSCEMVILVCKYLVLPNRNLQKPQEI